MLILVFWIVNQISWQNALIIYFLNWKNYLDINENSLTMNSLMTLNLFISYDCLYVVEMCEFFWSNLIIIIEYYVSEMKLREWMMWCDVTFTELMRLMLSNV